MPPQATAWPSLDDWQNVASPPQATAWPSLDDWHIFAWPPHATAWPSLDDWQKVASPPHATALPSLDDWQNDAPCCDVVTVCSGVPVAITQPVATTARAMAARSALMLK
jgi:hypothetical protein